MSDDQLKAVEYLRLPSTIRSRAKRLQEYIDAGESKYFSINRNAMTKTVELVAEECRRNYPALDIPYHSRWQHFQVGGVDRIKMLNKSLEDRSPAEIARSQYDLAIVSVLLDAGAGSEWRYRDPKTQDHYERSEGLAVASFHMFTSGLFSKDQDDPYRVDAAALLDLSETDLMKAFQVNIQNPLTGLEGRLHLLNELGACIESQPKTFGPEARLGNIYNSICESSENARVSASEILKQVLGSLSTIWPSRLSLGPHALGDVWHHEALQTNDLTSGLIPFHKLSQWLSYSLIEPLEWSGIEVDGIEALTGLPEYRNGGLLIDTGLLVLKDAELLSKAHAPSDPIIVEWRALTVALLDEIGDKVRHTLQHSDLSLASILQGGTWSTGRRLANQLREGGVPPLQIESDGTVF